MILSLMKIVLVIIAVGMAFGMEYYRRLDGFSVGQFYPFLSKWLD